MDGEEIKKLAQKAWEIDQRTNPATVNPHAFEYGYVQGYRAGINNDTLGLTDGIKRQLASLTRCSACGSPLVEIRGKFPGDPKRTICPTCTYEKLEQIHDISSQNYGKAHQEK